MVRGKYNRGGNKASNNVKGNKAAFIAFIAAVFLLLLYFNRDVFRGNDSNYLNQEKKSAQPARIKQDKQEEYSDRDRNYLDSIIQEKGR